MSRKINRTSDQELRFHLFFMLQKIYNAFLRHNYPHFVELRNLMHRVYGSDGADLQTQVRRFFLDAGLTEQELETFESILLTD